MLNTAIIGLGWWGKTLARAARSGGEITIVAGATGRRALAEDFAAEQGFDLWDSYEQVLADPRVDAVILATPHLDHEAQMIAAARAGKHIFAEKPFTLTKASAEAAVAAIRAAGVSAITAVFTPIWPICASACGRAPWAPSCMSKER